MELYVGIDLHGGNCVVSVLDETDRTVYARRFPNDLGAIVAALRGCAGTVRGVAVESTYNWYWLYRRAATMLQDRHHLLVLRPIWPVSADTVDGVSQTGLTSDQ